MTTMLDMLRDSTTSIAGDPDGGVVSQHQFSNSIPMINHSASSGSISSFARAVTLEQPHKMTETPRTTATVSPLASSNSLVNGINNNNSCCPSSSSFGTAAAGAIGTAEADKWGVPIIEESSPPSTQHYVDSNSTASSNHIKISPTDVLFGNENAYVSWPGNMRLQQWIEERRSAFAQAPTRSEQTRIAREIVELVQKQYPPGRFLEYAGGPHNGWSALDSTDIFVELGKALRQVPPITPTVAVQEHMQKSQHGPPPPTSQPYASVPQQNHYISHHPNQQAYMTPVVYHQQAATTTADEEVMSFPAKRKQEVLHLPLPSPHELNPNKAQKVLPPEKQQLNAGDFYLPEYTAGKEHQQQQQYCFPAVTAPSAQVQKFLMAMKQQPQYQVVPPAAASGSANPTAKKQKQRPLPKSGKKMIDQDYLYASLPKGVTMRPSGKWQAQIYFCGQSRYIGVYTEPHEANFAYSLVQEKLSEKRHVQHGKEEAAQIFSKAREDAEKAVMAARRKNSK